MCLKGKKKKEEEGEGEIASYKGLDSGSRGRHKRTSLESSVSCSRSVSNPEVLECRWRTESIGWFFRGS